MNGLIARHLLFVAATVALAPSALAADDLVALVKRVQPGIARLDTETSLGSGAIIDASGLILTNYHVVEGATWGKVVLSTGKVLDVRGFVAAEIGSDIAVLKVDPIDKQHVLPIFSGTPSAGEKVAAFGNPQGLSFSTSEGIVSAVRNGQQVADSIGDPVYRAQGYDYGVTWIQTTAPISPGNSGGPLTNMQGQIIGLNTWHHTGGQNLNFAIASADIRRVLATAGELRDLAKLPKRKKKASSGRREGEPDIDIVLPTGRTFNPKVFTIPLIIDQVASARDANGIAVMRHANGSLYASARQVNGILDGPTLARYDNGRIMTYAMYSQGRRHGLVETWDEGGDPVYFAQYLKGKPHGFCCYFEEGELRLLCEHDQGDAKWIQIMSDTVTKQGFSDRGEAEKNVEARSLLDKLAAVEEKLKTNEVQFKKQVKEHNLRLRKILSTRQSVEKRKKLLAEIDRENAANAAFHTEMIRRAMNGNR